jgi:hypothetical protein
LFARIWRLNRSTGCSNQKWGRWLAVVLIHVAIATGVLTWCLFFDPPRLRSQLVSVIPWFLEINFLLIIIAFVLSFGVIRKQLKGISSSQWWLVSTLVVLGMVLTALVAPRTHRLFYDENIYLNIGQTMAAQKKAAMCAEGFNRYGEYHCVQLEHNKQPYAFPHLISLVYRLFGTSERAGFLFNNLVFGLAILTAFLIGFLLFQSFSAGLYSALIYCLIPENIIWANTTAVEPSTALFSGLVTLAAVSHFRKEDTRILFLLSALLAYSVQFRTESILLIPLIGLFLLLFQREVLRKRNTYLFLAISFALLVPHMVQLYAVRGENWGSPGPRMGFSYFWANLRVNSLFYFSNVRFPLLSTLLMGYGILLRGNLKAKTILTAWFFLFWGVFLFFYAGSFEFGQDVRFSLVSYMPLSLLAGLGLYRLERALEPKGLDRSLRIAVIAAICLSFTGFMPLVRTVGEEACQARADHKYARQMAELLPDESMVLTHNPNMFLLWGKNAAQAAIATHNEPLMEHFFRQYTGGVYFHYNYWCNTTDPRERAFCRNILDHHDHTALVEYTERGYTFALYRLNRRLSSPKQHEGENAKTTDSDGTTL